MLKQIHNYYYSILFAVKSIVTIITNMPTHKKRQKMPANQCWGPWNVHIFLWKIGHRKAVEATVYWNFKEELDNIDSEYVFLNSLICGFICPYYHDSLFWSKISKILIKNVCDVGLQVCIFSHIWICCN